MTPTPSPAVPTRQRLRSVALELFARHGYGGASMAEIARGVGVQKATLYNYYPSKESLLLDLLEQGLAAWGRASRVALRADGPLRERLQQHLEAVLDYASKHPHEAAVVRLAATQIGGELGVEVRRRLEAHKAEYMELLAQQFAAAIDAGEVRNVDPVGLARTWRALLNGMLIQYLFEGAGGDVRRSLEQVWEIVWKGMAAREEV